MIDGSGFLQEYMKNKVLADQGEIVFNPFKFFGGEPLKQRGKLEEGTLTEEEEIDTGLGVGNALAETSRAAANDGATRTLIMGDNDFPAVMANGGNFSRDTPEKEG